MQESVRNGYQEAPDHEVGPARYGRKVLRRVLAEEGKPWLKWLRIVSMKTNTYGGVLSGCHQVDKL